MDAIMRHGFIICDARVLPSKSNNDGKILPLGGLLTSRNDGLVETLKANSEVCQNKIVAVICDEVKKLVIIFQWILL